MTKDQLAIGLVLLGMLAGAIQQFYALKTEVSVMHDRIDYVFGPEQKWSAPPRGQE